MISDQPHLAPRPANHRPLSPVDFLDRAVAAHPDRLAVLWGARRWSHAGLAGIVCRMADWLETQGIGPGDVVSVMASNRPEMLAAHYAVPMLGAVLNAVNTRLDAGAVAQILTHAGSRLILADPPSADTARTAAAESGAALHMLGEGPDALNLLDGPPGATRPIRAAIADEWAPIALNYTSGTTGGPKGVVLHHRGAYLNGLGNVVALGLGPRSVYLWTLPMFHCNGWCHTWGVTAAGGVHLCLDRPEPAAILGAIAAHGVTHMACAPVVLYMLLHDPGAEARRGAGPRVTVASGGAAPSAALIAGLEEIGFDFLHLYGLTESYGPATLCAPFPEETGPEPADRARRLSRQGTRHVTAGAVQLLGPDGAPVPADGLTLGEIVLTGNTLMAGYHRDPEATARAFAGGGFRTGDLAVRHPDGEIEIRDRAKDIIISGGENVSSLEVENVLHAHPSVLLAAVVAAPDDKWGEIPCAFVELKPGAVGDPAVLESHCRAHLAGFKIPRRYEFGPLPRTATGKIRKFALRARLADPGTGAG